MNNKIDWNNLFKVKIANADDSFQKHEIVKLLLVMKILNKNKRKYWIRIYTECSVNENKCDVYFEDIKKREIIIYEIQKKYTKKWLEEKTKQYNNLGIYKFKADFIPINLNELSDNIKELNKQLDKYIF